MCPNLFLWEWQSLHQSALWNEAKIQRASGKSVHEKTNILCFKSQSHTHTEMFATNHWTKVKPGCQKESWWHPRGRVCETYDVDTAPQCHQNLSLLIGCSSQRSVWWYWRRNVFKTSTQRKELGLEFVGTHSARSGELPLWLTDHPYKMWVWKCFGASLWGNFCELQLPKRLKSKTWAIEFHCPNRIFFLLGTNQVLRAIKSEIWCPNVVQWQGDLCEIAKVQWIPD